ncbi:MAG: outer membrane protein assembly factor BamA [Acidobacteria bacterium]|nr:outer membrane protein assembly factor BamA [Acidobacteriota bacterium]
MKTYIGLALLLLGLPGIFDSARAAEVTLGDVVVQGNRRLSREAVLHHLGAVPDARTTELALQESFRRLWSLGVLDDLSLELSESESGALLTVSVREKPLFSGMKVEGTELPDDRIRRALEASGIHLKPASPYDPYQGWLIRQALLELEEKIHHPKAEVDLEERVSESGSVELVFRVREGPRLKIAEIDFVGNATFSDARLEKQMRWTKERGWLTAFTRKDALSRVRLREDLERVEAFYRSQGYARVEVSEPRVQVREEDERLTIVVWVREGPRYRLGKVSFSGQENLPEKTVAETLAKLGPARWLDFDRVEEGRQKILELCRSRGYVMADVQARITTAEEAGRAAVEYEIREGKPFLVRRIDITGNHRLPDRLFRRQLLQQEGRLFNAHLLQRSLRRLKQSGMTDGLSPAEVRMELDPNSQTVDLSLQVRERGRQGIWLSGSALGTASLIYDLVNLLGWGERVQAELAVGPRILNLTLGVLTQNFLGVGWDLGWTFFNRFTRFEGPEANDIRSLFTRRGIGGALAATRVISSASQLAVQVQSERIAVRDRLAGFGQLFAPGTVNIQSRVTRTEIRPTWIHDSTEGYGAERQGRWARLSAGWAGGPLGGDIHLLNPSMDYRFFQPDSLSRGRHGYAARFLLSGVHDFRHDAVPFHERFFAGGSLVRGFNTGEVSPRSAQGSTGVRSSVPVGGDLLGATNFEYRIPVRERLDAAYFFDLGFSGLARKGSLTGVRTALQGSTGGELQLRLPWIGQPVRLIFAWNPFRFHEDRKGRIKLGFGQLF